MTSKKINILALGLYLALTLTGCSSSVHHDGIFNKSYGNEGNSGTYGSGPNNTRPYPQDSKVNINGVPGAKVRYEPLSKGGNKNYTVLGKNYQVWRNCTSYQEIGTASWYGPGFHGNKTSNGERYNQKGFSAAHKNLPLPSYLKVTNLTNGKAVVVRVNDRGPFHGNRIIDLSEGAARAINMTGAGTAKVKLELINVRPNGVIANLSSSNVSGTSSKKGLDSIGQVITDINNGDKPSLGTTIAAVATTVTIVDKISDKVEKNNTNEKVSNNNYYTNQSADKIEQDLLNSQSYNDYANTAYIQFFSTTSESKAYEVKGNLQGRIAYPVVIVPESGLYRLRVGPVPEHNLNNTLSEIKGLGFRDSFIKRQ